MNHRIETDIRHLYSRLLSARYHAGRALFKVVGCISCRGASGVFVPERAGHRLSGLSALPLGRTGQVSCSTMILINRLRAWLMERDLEGACRETGYRAETPETFHLAASGPGSILNLARDDLEAGHALPAPA